MDKEVIPTAETNEFVAIPTYESFEGDDDKALDWIVERLHGLYASKEIPSVWGDPNSIFDKKSLREVWNNGSDEEKNKVIRYVGRLK